MVHGHSATLLYGKTQTRPKPLPLWTVQTVLCGLEPQLTPVQQAGQVAHMLYTGDPVEPCDILSACNSVCCGTCLLCSMSICLGAASPDTGHFALRSYRCP
jgi:hypothetical protein